MNKDFDVVRENRILNTLFMIRGLDEYTPKNLKDAFDLTYQLEDPINIVRWCKWVRKEAARYVSSDMLELIHKTYLLAGRHSFDDYMIACEWNREPQARFWLPRRAVLEGKHKIATQIQEFIDDDEALYLGFSMPPGTGKTTLIKFLLAYIAGKFPDSFNMYVSYADGVVKMILDSARSILTDTDEYDHNRIFPGLPQPDISSEFRYVSYGKKGNFPTLGLVSLGGSVTGRTRANKFLITDDLVKDKEMARSPERLDNLYNDYKATLTTRMIGSKVKQIQLGTIWSKWDPISRMKADHEDDPRYKFIAIPVWDEDENSNFEYDHPDNYTTAKIRDIMANMEYADFSCLFLQRGLDKEGLALKRDEMNFYNGVLPDGDPDKVLFSCDVAWGGGDSLSMPICYVFGQTAFIHDVVFDKRDKTFTKPRVVGKILQHKANMGRFEANNGGDEYAEDIDKTLRTVHRYSCNITHKKAPTNMAKATRIEQYVPDIKRWYFISPKYQSDEYRKFFNEACEFSFSVKNKHDDAIDSLGILADFMNHGGSRQAKVFKRPF